MQHLKKPGAVKKMEFLPQKLDNMEMVVLIKIIYYFQIQRKYLISYLSNCQKGTNAINFIWLVYLMAWMMKINKSWNFGLLKISIVKGLHSSWANDVPDSLLSKSVVVIQLAVALAKESLTQSCQSNYESRKNSRQINWLDGKLWCYSINHS